MYMPDCLKALIDLDEADFENLVHFYDLKVSGFSFSVGERVQAIEERIPNFTYEFQPRNAMKLLAPGQTR